MTVQRVAVLLRGVNVGGHRRVPMGQWAQRLADLGCVDVVTHLQSGQAVVTTGSSAADLSVAVRTDLADGFDVDTAVLVRTHAQLRAVVDGCPWPEAAAQAPTTVHALFVEEQPDGWWQDDPDRYAPERAADGPGVVYLLLPEGSGRSRMPSGGGSGTARNWRTVRTLLELTGGPRS